MSEPMRPRAGADEPDPRVLLANERTLLAYDRTALGLLATGMALAGSHTAADLPVWFAALGVPLVVLSTIVATAGRKRFARVHHAIRHAEPLPPPTAAALVSVGIALTGIVCLVVATLELATSG